MTELQKELLKIADKDYAAFQAKLAPTVPPESCLGVRIPELRKFAARFAKTPECAEFLKALPHVYYDENMLHSILLCGIKNYEQCIAEVERFLPFVDNWAACDTLRPKIFAKHRAELLPKAREWIASGKTYTVRFGVDILMSEFLDEDYSPELLEIPASVVSGEYYVNMMVAWYYATALAKHWDDAVKYIENTRLPEWTRRKAIQKACESFRITKEQKEYLKKLR